MTDNATHSAPRRVRLSLGHPNRLNNGTLAMSLIFVGYFSVFLASLFHDEIALELANRDLISASVVEVVELAIGLGLFICWGALTAVQIRFFDRVRSEAMPARDGGAK